MSLVGNFAFGNADRTTATAGAGDGGLAFQHQVPSTAINRVADDEDDAYDQGRRGSAISAGAATGRLQSNHAVSRDQTQHINGTGIHNGTYYPDGITPEDEKDVEKGGIDNQRLALSDTPSDETDEKEQARREFEVTELAKTLTRDSTWSQVPANPFEAEEGSALDPHSPNFRARSWVKSMIKLRDAENKLPGRTGGVAFRNLNAHGYGAATDYQKDVGNVWLDLAGLPKKLLGMSKPRRIDILRDFEGVVESGEMLVVLGPPGSGCSTFLKTMTGETHGFVVDDGSWVNYQGIPPKHMHTYFRGENIYSAETDVHFPMLTVGDTLTFAAQARAPKLTPGGVKPMVYAQHLRDVFMATFGISHTVNTLVGNDFVRGVSGGERKRVSIAEAALSGAPLQAWDNSTRGLDSANAVEFCKTVRLSTELGGCAAMVAIYQAPQAAYDTFDKAIVLYEGRQIFFGKATTATAYFEGLGFHRPDRQTDADFCTSMTSSQERIVRSGYENKVPRTSDEFAAAWKNSPQRAQLLVDIESYEQRYPYEGEQYQSFVRSRQAQQAKGQRMKSPYTLSYAGQVKLCLWRGFRRLAGDPSLTFTQLFGNFAMALVLGSVFYNMPQTTGSFFQRGAVLFFAVLLNAFGSALEILTLYAQRPIVEKHSRFAFYHPSAEAVASMLTDMPYKVTNAIIFNITLYFMANLRREPGAFFFFVLVSFLTMLVMSMMFRCIASFSRTLSQAMAPAAIIILAIVIFTGFAIPVDYMLGWCRWINWIDPVAYGFESLMINEFHNRDYSCSAFVPAYGDLTLQQQVCSAIGSQPGQNYVNGDAYINSGFQYYNAHKWRNVGIIIGFTIFLMFLYLAATELISSKKSKGEVLVFRRGHTPASLKEKSRDVETADAGANGAPLEKKESYVEASNIIQRQTAIFSWKDVCYDIKIKSETRRILDHVDGWVKPGTLTGLMGVSGAGKTTLLDVLATRVTMGVISGDMLVDGHQRDSSFQRKTGYVQQQDLHLQTTTVREALNFSALLRQPAHVPRREKLEYVNEVIKLLDMEEYADAVVGVPGEGLNVEQRKRLTIGVELSAKPELLLFLDEPTSGLDSQTSWAICDLMEKLKNSGQAILCTIHQPSAMLFQRFDRLLFLAKGGKTVYFGEVGANSKVLSSYFERHGSHKCPRDANPAEWMLEVIGAAPGSHTDIDWHETWRGSKEYAGVHAELEKMKSSERPQEASPQPGKVDKESYREFAAPFGVQMREVTYRVFQQYWRTPSYIYSKAALCLFSSLFIGFAFYKAPLTQQGLQNQMFSIFMLFTIFGQLTQQIMPHFVTQRALYEARERPSKAYGWRAFMFANIIVELPWNTLMAVIIFFCFYYPIGLYNNAVPTNEVHLRGFQFFLFVWQFLLFTSTFTNMMIAGIADAETGGNLANLLFSLSLIFCGVLASPTTLPRFWIFMYRVSPFTYLVEGMLSVGVANTQVACAANEFVTFRPPAGQTCSAYMQQYISAAGGYLQDPGATSACNYCTYSDTNIFLRAVSASYAHVWRDYGILWVYIIVNACGALFFYWLARVPKKAKKAKKE
ncbi:Multidrug resistance protein [Friedmanniomyces endolithicus]|uniref:Multidrug resistance protein n=2 Tax=Friedmanniomyces endolithicus TaxID=329885 RepID=A0AAN6R301_9PEZI|nr:Multidrug resistance protein [Friedmanniomyces endolithicus]KAK0295071.1 Multidrug resistance protein [Friedmanniomyces endolithicus]KAK0931348.1 Multidrug resistance protein [Friedmanniomyces endolithicus]KAK1010858.1 Multidrug resistance protein [Friedmanniomyces endolithicus]KAK1016278.1 Multidrug resistance protein [Friedmanniomyces endolithicus]